ncbi:MAG TPA: helicase [Chloroflexi bacterium]|nr:helicase [Chloroflexota bacterium]
MTRIVYFDLETQKLAEEVGGWHNIRRMGLAAAVIYSTADEQYHDYTEENVEELIAALRAADLVVGFNLLRFDYEVLRAYTDDPLDDLPTVDMLVHLTRALGHRVSLDQVASATLGETKSADGVQAVYWYRQGLIEKVLDYCRQDVAVTKAVYEFGKTHGYVRFRDRRWRIRRVPVRW